MKILQLCPRIPYPPVDGGTIGMYNLSNALVDCGAEVKVLAFNTSKHFIEEKKIDQHYAATHKLETVYIDNSVKPLKAFFNLFSSESYHIARFKSEEFSRKLKQILTADKYDIVQIDYLPMSLYIDDIRQVSDAKVVLRAHNVEYRIWKRLAADEKNPLKKLYLSLLSERLYKYEKDVLGRIDALVTLTDEETTIFRNLGYKGPVCIAPTCFYIEKMTASEKKTDFSLFHLGAMDWMPNQEGMEWFLNDVWPRVKSGFPSVKLYIAGNNMPDRFFAYADERCSVQGRVPDAREFMLSHSVMVVPLLAGSGIRVKIVEGMALGKTIISTSQGAEGLHYVPMENIIIADTAEEMYKAIALCYSSPELCSTIGTNARRLAEDYYDMHKVGEKVAAFYHQLLLEKGHVYI